MWWRRSPAAEAFATVELRRQGRRRTRGYDASPHSQLKEVVVNVYELQLDGVVNEQQLHAARWELFVCPEVRDVVLLANGHTAVLYDGAPDAKRWLGLLAKAGYTRMLAAA
jgi:hypothetical protein